MFKVDKALPIALYYQVQEDIRSRIVTKQWASGSRIPSEMEICRMYDVSRITVRKALEALQQEGCLERIQGKGTYVSQKEIAQKLSKFYSFSEELKKKGRREMTELKTFETVYAGERLAEKLWTAPGTQVYRIIRTRFIDENPYAYEESFIPCKLAEGLTGEMVRQNGLYRSLNLIGTYLDNANESFRAINLRAEVAEILRTEPGRAAISLTRVAFSGKRLVEFCNSIVRSDFFSYTVKLK